LEEPAVKTLKEQLNSYATYHRDPRNKLTHFIGVPLVTFALFLFLSWFRFAPAPETPFTAATIFYVVVFAYYLCLDRTVALLQAPFTLALLFLADWVTQLPFTTSAAVFGATMIGGWVIQLAGHAIEGKRPALADNVMQIFNAPLFLTVEVMLHLGFRKDLQVKALAAQRETESELSLHSQ
jgi:uncharacterized membrane protein YGL010W